MRSHVASGARAATPAVDAVAQANTATPAGRELHRRLGFWSATALVIGIIIGSGIFRMPSSIAAQAGSVEAIALLWLLGGVITLCLALSLAELAALFPRAGGIYVYIREVYGPFAAFLYGWTFMLVNPAMWAGVSLIFAEYLGQLITLDDYARRGVAAALICGATLANYRSVWLAVSIQNLATVAKALALLGVGVVIFWFGSGLNGAFSTAATQAMPTASSLGLALVGVLYAYDGVANFCALSGEVRDPGRTLPRALTVGVLAVMALYLLMNAAYLYALPIDIIATSNLVAADAMMQVAGPIAAGVVAALIMMMTGGTVTAVALSDPRVFYAMANDGLFFRKIGAVHTRFDTPHVAVLISGAIAVLYVSLHKFEELAAIFVLGLWPFYALCVLGVILLRFKRPDLPRPYRIPGYPWVPLIFIASSLLVLVNSLIAQPRITLIDVAITCSGIPVYLVWRRVGRLRASP